MSDERALRVVHVISTPRGLGGAERLVADLVADGRQRGLDVTVLNPFAADPDDNALRQALPDNSYRGLRATGPQHLPRVLQWLTGHTRGADVVHAHLFHAAAAVAAMPWMRARRVLTHHHGDVLLVNGRRLAQRFDDAAVRRYDLVAAVSRTTRDFLVARGLPAARVEVVPTGWRGQGLVAPVPHEGSAMVCVANLRPEKDHETLLQAFAELTVDRPDARLRLVGDGPRRAPLAELARQLGLEQRVTFVGACEDVRRELGRADVFCLSSRYEGMSVALLEAMAAGLPAVVTDVGAARELIGDTGAGLVVPPRSPAALASALRAMLDDPVARARQGELARQTAAQYRIESMLERYAHLYRRLIQEQPA